MANKQKILKWIKPISIFLLGTIIGGTTAILCYCLSSTTIKAEESYDPWQISYYVFHIVGAIGTMLAVIVALSKESIMKWLYSPSLSVDLTDNGVSEILPNENQRVPEAKAYKCYIDVSNNGSLSALNCRAYISNVKYGRSKGSVKSINREGSHQVWWANSYVDIPVGVSSKIKLFEISNPNSIGTPQIDDTTQNPMLRFNKYKLSSNKSERGFWEIDYFITCKNGKVKKFALFVEWNGEFKSRAADMEDVLKVKLVER